MLLSLRFEICCRITSKGQYSINIKRYSSGVLYRLGIPVAVLLVLVGLIFWSQYRSRIRDTMTILLSVSALYIVIFGNIPLVGYLTIFDSYMIGMYAFVALCVVLHQLTFRMTEKHEQWPMREIYTRVLDIFGRIFVLPVVVFTYYFMFRDSFGTGKNSVVSILAAIVTIVCISGGLCTYFCNINEISSTCI